MADELFALTADDVSVLRDVVRAYRAGELGRPQQLGRRPLAEAASIYAAVASSTGVAAMAAGVAGSATVTVATVSTSGLLAESSHTVKAYNLSTSAVSANANIQIKREALTGRWLVDFENCT